METEWSYGSFPAAQVQKMPNTQHWYTRRPPSSILLLYGMLFTLHCRLFLEIFSWMIWSESCPFFIVQVEY
jgi:hypothetical protein